MGVLQSATKAAARAGTKSVKEAAAEAPRALDEAEPQGLTMFREAMEGAKKKPDGTPVSEDLRAVQRGIQADTATLPGQHINRSTISGPIADHAAREYVESGIAVRQNVDELFDMSELEAPFKADANTPNHPLYDMYRSAAANFTVPSTATDMDVPKNNYMMFEQVADAIFPYKIESDLSEKGRRVGKQLLDHPDEQHKLATKMQMKMNIMDNRRFHPDVVFDPQSKAAFREWWGEGSIADPEGNPMVLFRTGSPLGASGVPKSIAGTRELGMHAGTRSAALDASGSVGGEYFTFGGPGKVVDVYYTNVKKPLVLPDVGYWGAKPDTGEFKVADEVMRKIPSKEKEIQEIIDDVMALNISEEAANVALRKVITDAGYDSIAYMNGSEALGSLSYIIFKPENIKSIRNIGTFSPHSENVLKSIVGPTLVTGGAVSTMEADDGSEPQ